MTQKQASIASYFSKDAKIKEKGHVNPLTKDVKLKKTVVKTSQTEMVRNNPIVLEPLPDMPDYEDLYEQDEKMLFVGKRSSHKNYFVSRYENKYFHIPFD